MKESRAIILVESVLALVFILALGAVIWFVLRPTTHLQDVRNSQRVQDLVVISDALQAYQVDYQGRTIPAIFQIDTDEYYMIGTAKNGCAQFNEHCSKKMAKDINCIDLSLLVEEKYLGLIPVSPPEKVTWSQSYTGYYLTRNQDNVVTLGACDLVHPDDIQFIQ